MFRLLFIIAAFALGWYLAPAWWPLWVLGIAFSPGCSCCGSSCTYVTDDFSSNDLSTAWNNTTPVGSWNISGGVLTCSTTNSYLINNTLHPAGTAASTISADMQGASGDKLRIYGAWKDSSHYIVGEAVVGSSGTLNIYSNAGSGEVLQATVGSVSIPAATSTTFTLCLSVTSGGQVFPLFQGGTFSGGAIGSANLNNPLTIASGSSGFGVGTGSVATSVVIDNVAVSRTDNSCPQCSGLCGYCSPTSPSGSFLEYEVVITGLTNGACGSCTTINGTPLIVQLSTVNISFSICTWTVPFSVCGTSTLFFSTGNEPMRSGYTGPSGVLGYVVLTGGGALFFFGVRGTLSDCGQMIGMSLLPDTTSGTTYKCGLSGASATIQSI